MNQFIMIVSFVMSPLALVIGVLLGKSLQRKADQQELDQAHRDHMQLVGSAKALQCRYDTASKMLGDFAMVNHGNMAALKEWEKVTEALVAKVDFLEGHTTPPKPHLRVVK